ncbi:PTS sugar transporter subunit IIA [Butyrivibrio sp. AE3009]|uniref:PTS sugar transporter subunit IIA n=1 Tax=Butyrivibrio sp. AE3009 TaxID=1280666 RepID=UPI0003B58D63|nr:PTS glucose transporter subunit IIA [Butyrivibrio sp. AE3009]
MGIFSKVFHGNTIEIAAPVSGEIVPIQRVPDPVFSEEMVGKGVAIIPEDGRFYAPADGELAAFFPTGHAFCVLTKDGAEVFVHIGIDTVKLEGRHFTTHAAQGDTVKKGQLIATVDLEAVKSEGFEIITLVIITNPDSFSSLDKKEGKVAQGDAAIILEKQEEK